MIDRLVKIPNGCNAEIARYKTAIIPDYRGNPLIEALPDLLTDSEVIEKLANYPEYNLDEREMEAHYRIHMVGRLFQIFQPLPLTMKIENRIARAIRQGYIARNPFSPDIAYAYGREYKDSVYNPSSSGFTIIGASGIGKTTALHHILNLYPQVISHSSHSGKPLSTYQVVWLKLECPYDGSIKGLMLNFFLGIDSLLGTEYFKKVNNATTDKMISVMNQVVLNINLGLFVIDEIQHLSLAKSGGSQKMLNFFVNLVNSVGIPIVLVGTPKSMSVLGGEFRLCRRGIGIGGDVICDRLKKDRIWDLLIQSIWNYQWTKNKIELTEELSQVFYEETQGIPDLLIKLYAITQVYSISSGKEYINPNMIRKAAKDNFKFVQPMLKALKSGNIREMAKYEDAYITDLNIVDVMEKTKESIQLNFKTISKLNKIRQNDIIKNDSEARGVEKSKRDQANKSAINEYAESDIRFIVKGGAKNNKNAYEALKEYGYVKSCNEYI